LECFSQKKELKSFKKKGVPIWGRQKGPGSGKKKSQSGGKPKESPFRDKDHGLGTHGQKSEKQKKLHIMKLRKEPLYRITSKKDRKGDVGSPPTREIVGCWGLHGGKAKTPPNYPSPSSLGVKIKYPQLLTIGNGGVGLENLWGPCRAVGGWVGSMAQGGTVLTGG